MIKFTTIKDAEAWVQDHLGNSADLATKDKIEKAARELVAHVGGYEKYFDAEKLDFDVVEAIARYSKGECLNEPARVAGFLESLTKRAIEPAHNKGQDHETRNPNRNRSSL